ncbi:hypothetical protein LCGC14_2929060, partial [marine sediment metagenome]
SWQTQTARLAKLLTINAPTDLPAVDQFILDGGNPVLELNLIFAFSAGVTPYINGQPWGKGQNAGDRDTQGLVEFRDGQGNVLWWFNLPRSWDAEGNEQIGTFRFKKQGNSLYVSHRVPLSFVQGAVYPLMVDVTIDEQVGAGADDGWSASDSTYSNSGLVALVGLATVVYDSWARFTGISGLSGATIDVSFGSFFEKTSSGGANILTKLLADDQAAPSAPTDQTDHSGRTRTAAGVDWDGDPGADGFHDTPSLNTVIQELADSYDPSVIQILHDDDGSIETGFNRWETFDDVTSEAPKLHIEYTAAAGGVTVLAALATATALSPAATILTGLLVAASLATATALSLAAKHINTISAKVATAVAVSPASAVSGAALIAANL